VSVETRIGKLKCRIKTQIEYIWGTIGGGEFLYEFSAMLAQLRALRLYLRAGCATSQPLGGEFNGHDQLLGKDKRQDRGADPIIDLNMGPWRWVEMSPGAVNLRQKQMQKLLLDESNNTI
jgi:hypothetical protein